MSGMSGIIPSNPIVLKCEKLVIETVLTNPNMSILSKITVNDKFSIKIESSMGVVAMFNGQVVGTVVIDSSKMDKLIDCIEGGTNYEASIIELNPATGVCKIKIKAV